MSTVLSMDKLALDKDFKMGDYRLINYSKGVFHELKDWTQVVDSCCRIGFEKVTIISRSTYQTLRCTSLNDIATAWRDTTLDSNPIINENQEILDVAQGAKSLQAGSIGGIPKNQMRFYGQIYNILWLNTAYNKSKKTGFKTAAEYWCRTFQDDKSKLETFPKFIVDIIKQNLFIPSGDINCLVAQNSGLNSKSYIPAGEYLFVKVFKSEWFIAEINLSQGLLKPRNRYETFGSLVDQIFLKTVAWKDQVFE